MSSRGPHSDYRRYHPKWHRERLPIFWWLRKRAYAKFIGRELTSVFVAYAALLLLVEVRALAAGAQAHQALRAWLEDPLVVGFHVVVLLALLFHTVTWLNLAPKALVVHVGRRKIPAVLVLLGHYAAWGIVSLALAWLLLGGP